MKLVPDIAVTSGGSDSPMRPADVMLGKLLTHPQNGVPPAA